MFILFGEHLKLELSSGHLLYLISLVAVVPLQLILKFRDIPFVLLSCDLVVEVFSFDVL
jgi:hypothetical protein